MAGEYPKLLQQVDFLKHKVEQQRILIDALKAKVQMLEQGMTLDDMQGVNRTIESNTKIYEGEIED